METLWVLAGHARLAPYSDASRLSALRAPPAFRGALRAAWTRPPCGALCILGRAANGAPRGAHSTGRADARSRASGLQQTHDRGEFVSPSPFPPRRSADLGCSPVMPA